MPNIENNPEKQLIATGTLSEEERKIFNTINTSLHENIFSETGKKDIDLLDITTNIGQKYQELKEKIQMNFAIQIVDDIEKIQNIQELGKEGNTKISEILNQGTNTQKKSMLDALSTGWRDNPEQKYIFQQVQKYYIGNPNTEVKENIINLFSTLYPTNTVPEEDKDFINESLILLSKITKERNVYKNEDLLTRKICEKVNNYIKTEENNEEIKNKINTILEEALNQKHYLIVSGIYEKLDKSIITKENSTKTIDTILHGKIRGFEQQEIKDITEVKNKLPGMGEIMGLYSEEEIKDMSKDRSDEKKAIILYTSDTENIAPDEFKNITNSKTLECIQYIKNCERGEGFDTIKTKLNEIGSKEKLDEYDRKLFVLGINTLKTNKQAIEDIISSADFLDKILKNDKDGEIFKNIITDLPLQTLQKQHIPKIQAILKNQDNEEIKNILRHECIFNNPKDMIGNLTEYDTKKIFGCDQSLFTKLRENSPDRTENDGKSGFLQKGKIRENLQQMEQIQQEIGKDDVIKTIFETYNITCFARYPINILRHLYESQETPSGKPPFIFLYTKRDYNNFFAHEFQDMGAYRADYNQIFLEHTMQDYDIRIVEVGDDNQAFFEKVQNIRTTFEDNGVERNKPGVVMGMHGAENLMLKSASVNQTNEIVPSKYIKPKDTEFFKGLRNYFFGSTIALKSCSTGGTTKGQENIGQSLAKYTQAKVFAPTISTSGIDILFSEDNPIEDVFSANPNIDNPVAIYDGREEIMVKDINSIEEGGKIRLPNSKEKPLEYTFDLSQEEKDKGYTIIPNNENGKKSRTIQNNNNKLIINLTPGADEDTLSITGMSGENIKILYTGLGTWRAREENSLETDKKTEENNFRTEQTGTIILQTMTNIHNNENLNEETKIMYDKGSKTVSVQTNENIKKVEIFDMTGKQISSYQGNTTNLMNIPLYNSPNGIYIVRYQKENNKMVSQKILVQ